MTRRRLAGVGVAALAVALVVGVIVVRTGGRNDDPIVPGAVLVGGGGGVDPASEPVEVGTALEALDLEEADRVRSDGAGGLWIGVDRIGGGRVLHGDSGRVERTVNLDAEAENMAAHSDGQLAVGYVLGRVEVFGTGSDWEIDVESIGGLALANDGSTVLVAGRSSPTVISYAPDGTRRVLLGSLEDPAAEIQTDSNGSVRALAALPDDRLALVTTGGSSNNLLYVLGNGELQPLDVDFPDGEDHTIWDVTTTPDGRLLAVVSPPLVDGDPSDQVYNGDAHVVLIDPDSGEAESLADLTDLDEESSVSAAAVGDDVVLLADSRLWRLSDVFA